MIELCSIQNNSREKTMNRCVAGNSLRSTFSYIITVASTHFIVGKILSDKVLNMLQKEAIETIDLVSKLNNNTLCMPINPNLIFSTDDTTMYIFEGVEEKK